MAQQPEAEAADSSHLCVRKDVLMPAEMKMNPKAVLKSFTEGSILQGSTGCPF